MKLVILYGPPAVGKLTITEKLSEITGFKNFHNHKVLDILFELFGKDKPERRELGYEIRKLIVEKNDSDVILKKAIEEGMTTMLDDGLNKVVQGITTVSEVLRVTKTENA